MSEILGTTPPPDPQTPAMMSPDVARDIQRDAIRLMRRDAWLKPVIAIGLIGASIAFAVLVFVEPTTVNGYRSMWTIAQMATLAIYSGVAAWSSVRVYRRMVAEEAAGGIAPETVPPDAREHWLVKRSGPVILVLLLLSLAYQWYASHRFTTGPIVFTNATIATNTGMIQSNMTVAVADGHIAFVGEAQTAIPSTLRGARTLDAHSSMVAAATFDHTAMFPLEGLRHVWAGQLYEGAPGDIVITPFIQGRRRQDSSSPREVLGAVINGKYYSATDLQKR